MVDSLFVFGKLATNGTNFLFHFVHDACQAFKAAAYCQKSRDEHEKQPVGCFHISPLCLIEEIEDHPEQLSSLALSYKSYPRVY